MRLFEFAVWFKGDDKTDDRIKTLRPAAVIIQPTCVVAEGEPKARIAAARAIPDEWAKELDRIEVAVRPF